MQLLRAGAGGKGQLDGGQRADPSANGQGLEILQGIILAGQFHTQHIVPHHHQAIAFCDRRIAIVERHAMSKKGPETKKAEKSRENIKKAQFYVEFHAKPGDKLQKGA